MAVEAGLVREEPDRVGYVLPQPGRVLRGVRIDVVINNAGYGLFGAAEELTDEQIRHQIDTNLIGSIQVVRAALPHLRAQGGGRIIQISTYGGQATTAGGSLYNASKWGIEGFIEATMKDVAPFNIGVTIIEPGGAQTGFRAGSSRLGAPLDAYDNTPAAMVRGIRTSAHPSPGDPAKIAKVIIDSAGQNPAPVRITLGSDAYSYVRRRWSGDSQTSKRSRSSPSAPTALSRGRRR